MACPAIEVGLCCRTNTKRYGRLFLDALLPSQTVANEDHDYRKQSDARGLGDGRRGERSPRGRAGNTEGGDAIDIAVEVHHIESIGPRHQVSDQAKPHLAISDLHL